MAHSVGCTSNRPAFTLLRTHTYNRVECCSGVQSKNNVLCILNPAWVNLTHTNTHTHKHLSFNTDPMFCRAFFTASNNALHPFFRFTKRRWVTTTQQSHKSGKKKRLRENRLCSKLPDRKRKERFVFFEILCFFFSSSLLFLLFLLFFFPTPYLGVLFGLKTKWIGQAERGEVVASVEVIFTNERTETKTQQKTIKQNIHNTTQQTAQTTNNTSHTHTHTQTTIIPDIHTYNSTYIQQQQQQQ